MGVEDSNNMPAESAPASASAPAPATAPAAAPAAASAPAPITAPAAAPAPAPTTAPAAASAPAPITAPAAAPATAPASAPAAASASARKPKKYEALFDLPFGVDEYAKGEKRFSRAPAYVIVGVVAFLCKVLYRYRVVDRHKIEALAAESGVVIVSNHTSYLDVVLMYVSMFRRCWPRFMARDTLFEHGILGWIFAHIGAFPVTRDSADRTAVKRASRMLKNGEVVGIMPEGTRRGKGNVEPRVHGGAALIARMGKAPILPMAVRNVDKVKRKGERLRFPTITVVFGDPVLLSDFDFLPKDDRLEGCVWYALRECFALFNDVSPEEVNMVALFPDDKDFTATFAEHPVARRAVDE